MSTSVDQLPYTPLQSSELTPSQPDSSLASFEGFITLYNRSSSRIHKSYKSTKRSFDPSTKSKLLQHLNDGSAVPVEQPLPLPDRTRTVTLLVGPRHRKFSAHEHILSRSPFFASACAGVFVGSSRRIALVDEEPEVLSLVLEYLYKGDYSPRLLHDKHRGVAVLEDVDRLSLGRNEPAYTPGTIFSSVMGDSIFRDAAVYCSADRYGLEDLKTLALRKLRLVTGVDAATMLRSARFAYDHIPEVDAPLKAFFLSTFIRHRKAFAESKAMRIEMEAGGRFFFDLFVAMARHADGLEHGAH